MRSSAFRVAARLRPFLSPSFLASLPIHSPHSPSPSPSPSLGSFRRAIVTSMATPAPTAAPTATATAATATPVAEAKGETKSEGCCPPGAPGAAPKPLVHVSTGTRSVLGDLPVYITGTRSERGIVVVQEIYGIESGRLEQICDTIAAAGYVVAMADYHRGENFGQMAGDWSKFGPWLSKTPLSKIDSDLNTHVFPALAAKGATKFGMLGFCFGSLVVMHVSATGKLQAGASCHPSHSKLAGMFGTTSPALIGEVKCPQLVYAASDDGADLKPGGSEEKLLSAKEFGAKNEFKAFPDVSHGWVTRAEFSDEKPANARDYQLAIDGVLAFFAKNIV